MKKFFDIVMPVKTAACYIFTATMCVYAVLDLVFGWGGLPDNYLFSFLLLSLDRYDLWSNFTAVAACINNIGPGLGAVGPSCNFSGFGVLSKLVLIFDMLAGRLELFPILILFNPKAWSNR